MSWPVLFLIFYLGLSNWVATSILIFQQEPFKKHPIRAGWVGLWVMWIMPAFFLGAVFMKGPKQ